MRKRMMALACVAGALGAVLWTSEAKADVHGFSWEHATLNGGPRFGTDDLDFGLGLNVGYTLDMGLYLGGVFDYFFAQEGWDAAFFLFDIGYDIGFGDKFVLRPTGSLGMITGFYRTCGRLGGDCNNDSDSFLGGAFGANALYAIDTLTIGGEMRFFFDMEDHRDLDGVWIGFNIGVVF